VAAGADGIFVLGVTDAATIAALVEGVGVALNILAGPGAPSLAELARLGVARVSLGSSVVGRRSPRPRTPLPAAPPANCSPVERMTRWPTRSATGNSTNCATAKPPEC
jgi:hypothetical protein